MERSNAAFMASYLGGDKEDYDALNAGSPVDGDRNNWNAMLASTGDYQALQQYMDVVNYADYMVAQFYGGNNWDWNTYQNWMAASRRAPGDGYKFFAWDSDMILRRGLTANCVDRGGPGNMWGAIKQHAEFRMLVADRAQKYFFNDGILTYYSVWADFQRIADQMRKSIIAETARWGAPYGYTPTTWQQNMDSVLTNIVAGRTAVVIQQMRDSGVFPSIDAPTFRINGSYQHGGEISLGSQFSMTGGGGTIYYTTDGTDPRQVGGAAIGTQYTGGSIMLTEPTRFRARLYFGGEWSALNEAMYYINPPDVGDLTITEVNYNPYGPTDTELLTQLPAEPDFTASDFEFIELYNRTGHTIDLFDVEFRRAVELTVPRGPQTTLVAGQHAVIVANASAFEARYGTDVDVVGVFTGSLNNGGESIAFGHPVASMLEAFEYNDAGDWPNRADGGGSSLELIDIDGDHTAGSSWRSSSEYGGSPGLVGTGPRSDVVVNEVLTHSDDPLTDSIELYNTTGAPIDISGWFLSDGGPDYAKFEIPAGTVIPADGYVVFYEGHYVAGALEVDYATEFGGPGEKDFALSGARGDDVWLMEADASGNLLGFVDHVDFGAAINGESFGRWPDTLGDLYPMTSLTPGGANSPPRVGPVIISEIMYNPPDPDGVGGVDPDDLEFIELYNPTLSAIPLAAFTDNPHGPGQYFADWRLRGGVDMEFDAGVTIAAEGLLVVLSFDPDDPANATRVADFRTYYGIDAGVPLAGGYGGNLNDYGERIKLQRPDSPPLLEPDYVPHLFEDQANYDDQAPWATSPDGLGDSLQRVPITGWGDDPASWIGAAPDPGAYAVYDNAPVVDTPVGGVIVDEDSGDSVLDLSATFHDPDLDLLTLSVTGNTDPGMVTASMDGTDLTLSYVSDQNGSADITVRATDPYGAWGEETFTVTVNPTDDDPVVGDPIVSVTVDEDDPDTAIDLSSVFDDPDLPGDTLVFSVTGNTNTGLVTTSIVDGELVLSYVSDQYGTAEVTVEATDQNGAGVSIEDTFTVTVTPINDAPTVVSQIAAEFVDEDDPDTIIDLSGVFGDVDPTDTLTFSVVGNTNPSLLSPVVAVDTLTLSYIADQHGTADITIRATDSGTPELWVDEMFTVTVDPVDDAPTVADPIDNVLVFENDPDTVLNLAGVFDDVDIGDSLTLSVFDNTNPGLVTANMAGSQLTLSYLPNQYGTAEITIRATDSSTPGLWVDDTFTVDVNSDNFAPTVTNPIADVTVNSGSSDTVMYLSDVFADNAGVVPTLDYTAVEIDPVTGDPSAGTGLFQYKFTVYGHDGDDASFATTSLTFTGPIQQLLAFGSANVDDEFFANTFEGIEGSGYIAALDTWMYLGWQLIAPSDTSLSGTTVVVSAGSGTSTLYQSKDILRVVATGAVQWDGLFARQGKTYETSGTADGNRLVLSVEDNTNTDLVTASMLGSRLTLAYTPGAVGQADITVRATDPEGAWIEETFTVTVEPSAAEVVDRHIFYNNSALDAGGDDDAAIDPSKTPLLQGVATSTNQTSYSRGINGLMIDISGLTGTPTSGDIGVRVNQAANPDTWSPGPAPESVTVRPGEGSGGSDRVTLTWADGAITNQWVELTVLAGANTGLGTDDVFYVGNTVGDTNDDGAVDADDLATLFGEFGLRGGAELASDVNIDGRVNLTDFAIVRSNFGTSVGLPTLPATAPPAAAPTSEPNVDILAESVTSGGEAATIAGDIQLDLPPSVEIAPIDLPAPEPTPAPAAADDLLLSEGGLTLGQSLAAALDTDDLLVDILAESPLGGTIGY
jgi:hypothetical protein